MTYSIVARDAATGELGVAVQSRYFSTGSVVTWAEAGVGAVATQSLVKIDYGPRGLTLMRDGASAPDALAQLVAADNGRAVRQVAMIDATGAVATHTGDMCIAAAGHITGDAYSVQANMMTDDTIWPAMRNAYESATGDLSERMMAALDAAQAAGGDIRGQQSANILVVSGTRSDTPWRERTIDLRVEDHPRPLEELRRLLQLKRAYALTDAGDAALAASNIDEAMALYAQAKALAPDDEQILFFAALAMLRQGREQEAFAELRAAFAVTPALADLVPRLVPLGAVADDPALLARIAALRPTSAR